MAVTAKFLADFTAFEQGVSKAEVTLKDFSKNILSIDKDLTKMATAFSGQKVLQEATLAVKAVESIGGVSKLTANEQAKLNALVTEAIAKYDALGKQAPADLVKIQKETEKQESLFQRVTNALGPVGVAMAGAFTVTAITGAVTKVLSFADELENLSSKTGISTTGLQKLELAFQGSGVSIDSVTANVTKLAKNLIGDDKGAVDALKKLGLSVDTLKQQAPEQQFLAVADAVGKIQNPTEKAYAAMTIFGKGGAELLQGLDGHLAETTQHFEDMGLIIDEKTVKAADEFGDKMGLVGKQLLAILANAIGPMLPALSAMADAFGAVAKVVGAVLGAALKGVTIAIAGLYSAIADMLGNLADLAQKVPLVGSHLQFLAGASDWLHKSAEQSAEMMARLAFGTEDTAKAATKARAPLIGLGGDHEKAAKATKEHKDEVEQLVPALQLFYATVAQDVILQNATKHVAQFTEPFKDLQSEIPKTMQYMGMYQKQWNELSVSVSASAEDMQRHTVSAFGSLTDGITKGLDNLWKGMSGGHGFAGLMNNLGDSIVNGFGNILSGGLTSVINMGVQLAVEGVKKIGSLIAGLFNSEETKKVNGPRDKFFEQFGGYDGLAKDLTGALADLGDSDSGNSASRLISTLYDADTEAKFKSAERAIADVFKDDGKSVQQFRQGTKGQYLDFGAGTTTVLHGKERVMTEQEGKQESALLAELREQTRILRDQVRANAVAFANAMALA